MCAKTAVNYKITTKKKLEKINEFRTFLQLKTNLIFRKIIIIIGNPNKINKKNCNSLALLLFW